MAKKRAAPEVDLRVDPKAANRGTPRGLALLEESLDTSGVGRGAVADKHGTIIAGGKLFQAAQKRGIPIKVVQSDGQKLVVVRRTDLDLDTDRRARQLAYADNRVGEVDLSWSPEQLREDVAAGIDLTAAFFPNELDRFVAPDIGAPTGDAGSTPPDHSVEFPGPAPAVEVDASVPQDAAPPAPAAAHVVPIVLVGVAARLRWTAFLRALKQRYPDRETPGARLTAYITEATRG